MVGDIGPSPLRGSFHQNLIDIAQDFEFEFFLEFLDPRSRYPLIFQELFQPVEFLAALIC